jgi:hypothetical protein
MNADKPDHTLATLAFCVQLWRNTYGLAKYERQTTQVLNVNRQTGMPIAKPADSDLPLAAEPSQQPS